MGTVINLDRIEKIYINKAKPSKAIHYIHSQPERRTFFNLIKISNKVEPGWRGTDWDKTYSSRTELIKAEDDRYFIKEDEPYSKSIWQKPNIHIIMPKSDNVRLYYSSEEEMMAEVNDMIEKSNSNLMIVNGDF